MSLTIRILALSLLAALTPSCSDDSAARPLRKDASTQEQNALDRRLLRAAEVGSDVGAVEAALKAGADLESYDELGITPLGLAARGGHRELVTLLLKAGADVKTGVSYGITPLGLAARRGHHEVVTLLLKAGADVNAMDRMVPHTGTETRTRLLREAAVRNIGQWARA